MQLRGSHVLHTSGYGGFLLDFCHHVPSRAVGGFSGNTIYQEGGAIKFHFLVRNKDMLAYCAPAQRSKKSEHHIRNACTVAHHSN